MKPNARARRKTRRQMMQDLQLVYRDILLVDWLPVEIYQCVAYALLHNTFAYDDVDGTPSMQSIIQKYILKYSEFVRTAGAKKAAQWCIIRLLCSTKYTSRKDVYTRMNNVKQALLIASTEE